MLNNRMLDGLAVIAMALLIISVAPLGTARANDWHGGSVQPISQENTTQNTTIPQAVTPMHYMMAGFVLLFFIAIVALIIGIRRG